MRTTAGPAGTFALLTATIWSCLLLSTTTRAQTAAKPDSVALTIYSTAAPGAVAAEHYRPLPDSDPHSQRYAQPVPGFAVVKQEREVQLPQATSSVHFRDVAALIDPTTVTFESLSDPSAHVLEQSYQFDLVSTAKLLERFLDREITVDQVQGDDLTTLTGTLLSTAGGLVLRDADGRIQVVNGYANVRFPELPGGLITRPTLSWDVATSQPGSHRARVTYQTSGITWWADYNLVFAEGKDANTGMLDIGAWVSILNQSGADYTDTQLKLVAGDVHRAEPAEVVMAVRRNALAMAADAGNGFEEKAFFEYHLYTLGRRTTIPDRSTKQIELFPMARGVPADKVLVYNGLAPQYRAGTNVPMTDRDYGIESNKKVAIYLRFKNAADGGMGMPLPSGRIRVSKLDPADGTLEFIGEDTVDHTPKDETVLIKLGNAFDVVGERRQTAFRIDTDDDWLEEDVEIKLRNHKEQPVQVLVRENLYRWTNWEVAAKSHDHIKIDARTIEIPVQIGKDAEETVTYTVRYTW